MEEGEEREKKLGNEEELLPVVRASKRQMEILKELRNGEELVYEKGSGWWLGYDRTNGKVFYSLIRHLCLKDCSISPSIERYTITATGLKSLKTGWLYSHPKLK